jgi:hypothetical protein
VLIGALLANTPGQLEASLASRGAHFSLA